MSFSRIQFPNRAQALDAARSLTDAGIRLQSVDDGATLLVRSDDYSRAEALLASVNQRDDVEHGGPRHKDAQHEVVHYVDQLSEAFDATVAIPGSKSHTNRALLCAALATGRSTLDRVLIADDTKAMLGSLGSLGIGSTLHNERPAGATVTVEGAGPNGFRGPADGSSIDVRQSGTTSRFLLPVLAATKGQFCLDGDAQLRARPFGPQIDALRSLGAVIDGSSLPLEISGRQLSGGRAVVSGDVSSQFLSGLLLAAPQFARPTVIEVDGPLVSKPYIDLTVHTMSTFGIEVEADTDSGRFSVPIGSYKPSNIDLEPDASAASYFFAAAAMTGSRVRVEGLGRSTVQGDLGFVEVLAQMGADVTIGDTYTEVRGTGRLTGVSADMADISDTAQTLAVVAAVADSPTEISGIGFIRHKETDRIAASVAELNRLGVRSVATTDGFIVNPGPVRPGVVETYDDHRMAMSFALLGLQNEGIGIANPGCVAKTFPNYFDVLDSLR